MHMLYPWISLEHLRPLRSDSRPVSRWCPFLLPLYSLGVCGGHRERTKRPGQPPHPTSCNNPLANVRLKLGGFESRSNTTNFYHGFLPVELGCDFNVLMPASKLASCRSEPFSRVLPASNSSALPRIAAQLGVAMYSLVGNITSRTMIHQW